MFLFQVAIVCSERLLALHPLNPEYWIQFADFYKRSRNYHSEGDEPQLARLSLYNPEYPCRICTQENCTLCCIYRANITDIQTEIEQCCDCTQQDLAPEVHFQNSSCTSLEQPQNDTKGNSPQRRHGCTLLLQTPHRTYIKTKWECGHSKTRENQCKEHLNCVVENVGHDLEMQNIEGALHKANGSNEVNRTPLCISLVRAR